jgi:cAMP-dependent protein kinase regulator
VDTIRAGGYFGELSLMYNAKRNATVVSTTPASVWVLDRFRFRAIISSLGQQERGRRVGFLASVPLFAGLSAAERGLVADALQPVAFPANHVIFRIGDPGNAMYFVETGEVAVTLSDGSEVNRLSGGEFFGEVALTSDGARTAVVTTSTACNLFALDAQAFHLLIGSTMGGVLMERKKTYRYSTSLA